MTMGKRLWAERARANRRIDSLKISVMRFKSGKHEDKAAEEVLLKRPDFAQWTIEPCLSGFYPYLQQPTPIFVRSR